MPGKNCGCFVWLISFKKSCDKRWARFRNGMRQRFYARRGMNLDPESLLNETGTADMVVGKTSCECNEVAPHNMSLKHRQVIDDIVATENTTVAENKADNKLVEEFVLSIIEKAANILREELPRNKTTLTMKPADDNVSLSSSIISQIADIAVTESLSNVMMESDINHSAIRAAKTVKEFKEAFGIIDCDVMVDDGLPSVSV